jgi:hypothetical protein
MPTTGAAPPAALSATYSMRFPLAEALASARAAKPPAAADAAASPFAAEQEKLRQTLAQLENAKTDINEQRKEAAREKIARIKARLAALRLAGGDPKKIAREARRLLDELKNLMRGAKRRRAGKHGDADAAQANDALRSAEQAVSGLAAAFPSGAPSFAVSV